VYSIPASRVAAFLVYPLAASVAVAAGLLVRRMRARSLGWRGFPIVVCAAVVAGLFFLRGPLLAWGQPGLRAAPAFTLAMANGTEIASQELAGKTVVLAFWATWCKPCR